MNDPERRTVAGDLLEVGTASAPYPFEPGWIWLIDYPILYMGIRCNARTTLIRTEAGEWIVHSPCPLSEATRAFVDAQGPVASILAPGTFHHLYAAAWRDRYPQAGLFLCPGLERKVPALKDGTVIRDGERYPWSAELDHQTTRGSWIVNEVAFLHRPTKTLILTDLLENFTDDTPCNWATRIWLKYIFRMWNRPAPAPEYRIGWFGRRLAREVLGRILEWDFRRIVVAHGELVLDDAQAVARRAWASLLR